MKRGKPTKISRPKTKATHQPNRDYNASDFTSGRGRLAASAVVALIFSAKRQNLYLTGGYRK